MAESTRWFKCGESIEEQETLIVINKDLHCYVLDDAIERKIWKALCGRTSSELCTQFNTEHATVQDVLSKLYIAGLCEDHSLDRDGAAATAPQREEELLIRSLYVDTAAGTDRAPGEDRDVMECTESMEKLFHEVLQWCAFDLVVSFVHNRMVPAISQRIISTISGYEKKGHITAHFLIITDCPHCAKIFLQRDKVRTLVLLIVKDGDIEAFSEDGDQHTAFLVEADFDRVEEADQLIHSLARRFPKTLIKVQLPVVRDDEMVTDAFERILDVVRLTPQASFFNCGLQRMFHSLREMKPYAGTCSSAATKRLAVDLYGNVYPCRDLTGNVLLGNLFDVPLGEILTSNAHNSFRDGLSKKLLACAKTCSLAYVCGGCPAITCELAKLMLKKSVSHISYLHEGERSPRLGA